MLSFTNNSRQLRSNLNEIDFEPIIISNNNIKEAFPKQSQKKIVRTINNIKQKK